MRDMLHNFISMLYPDLQCSDNALLIDLSHGRVAPLAGAQNQGFPFEIPLFSIDLKHDQ